MPPLGLVSPTALTLRRCVAVLLTYSMWTYERLLPDLEVSELERGTLAASENAEILELNAGEELLTGRSKCIAFTVPYLLGGFLELNVIVL